MVVFNLPRQFDAVSCDWRNEAHIFLSECKPSRLDPCNIPCTFSTVISIVLVYIKSISCSMAQASRPLISTRVFSDSNIPFVNIAQRYGLQPHTTTLCAMKSLSSTVKMTSQRSLRSRNSFMTLKAFCDWLVTVKVRDSIIAVDIQERCLCLVKP